MCSEVFDHTSIIRFLERRFGVRASRTSCAVAPRGLRRPDLGLRLRSSTNDSVPRAAGTAGYAPPDDQRHPDYVPKPPRDGDLPTQEPGTRRARAVSYDLRVEGRFAPGTLNLRFTAAGPLGAAFQVRSSSTRPGHGPTRSARGHRSRPRSRRRPAATTTPFTDPTAFIESSPGPPHAPEWMSPACPVAPNSR